MSQDASERQTGAGPLPLESAPHHAARALRVFSNLRRGFCLGFTFGWSPGYRSLPMQIERTLFFGAPRSLTAFTMMAVWVLEIIIWNSWFVPATGAAPINNIFGAALFLMGISAFGRLIGPICVVFALWLACVGGQAHWLDMSLSTGPLAAYGIFCYVFGGDDDEDSKTAKQASIEAS